MSTLGKRTIGSVRLHWPDYGAWRADVTTQAGTLPDGARVTLTIKDLALVGTVLPGRSGFDAPDAWRCVVEGGAGWRTLLSGDRASYGGAGVAVKLSTVLKDLAMDCGETIPGPGKVGAPMDRDLGRFSRPFSISSAPYRGSDALALLRAGGYVGPWWPDAAGVTRLDARAPTAIVAGVAKVRVSSRDRGLGWRHIGTETPGLFVPGSIFEGARIARTIIEEKKGALEVVTWES